MDIFLGTPEPIRLLNWLDNAMLSCLTLSTEGD